MTTPLRLPGPSREGHYVYVVLFNTGSLKVGRTRDPSTRLKSHATNGRPHGISVAAQWLSQPHLLARKNESRLIGYCSSRYTSLNGGEFFSGAKAEDVVSFAEGLTAHADKGEPLRLTRFGRMAGRGNRLPADDPVVVLPIPAELLAAVDAARGDRSRAQWLQEAAIAHLTRGPAAQGDPLYPRRKR